MVYMRPIEQRTKKKGKVPETYYRVLIVFRFLIANFVLLFLNPEPPWLL